MPARLDSYLEKPGDDDGARPLAHVAVHERDGSFAVEEVVGEIDKASHRRGRIVIVAEGLSLEDAEHRYHEVIREREAQGLRPAH